MTLMLHAGGVPATLDDLRTIPKPARTDTYEPVGHAELADLVIKGVENDLGMSVRSTAFGMARGGAQMFGVVRVDSDDDRHGMVIGMRNSLDKSMTVALGGGMNMFVCDNLAFSGDVQVLRRHTKYVWHDLVKLLSALLEVMPDRYLATTQECERLERVEIGDDVAHSLFGQAYGRGVLGTRQFATASREWKTPQHDEFKPRTLWSAYNACTEALKSVHPRNALERYTDLHKLFMEAA